MPRSTFNEALTVAEEQKNNEVQRVSHALAIGTALRDDAVVHDLVPIFTCENLCATNNETQPSTCRHAHLKDSDQCGGELVEILQRCFVFEAESICYTRGRRRARTS